LAVKFSGLICGKEELIEDKTSFKKVVLEIWIILDDIKVNRHLDVRVLFRSVQP